MTIFKVAACRSFYRVVGAREGHDVCLGGCWGAVEGVRGVRRGVKGGSSAMMAMIKRPEGKVSRYVGVSCGYNRKITQDNGDQLDTFPLSCGYLGPRWVADGRRYSQMAQHGFNITPVALFSVNFCVLGGLVLSKNGDFT